MVVLEPSCWAVFADELTNMLPNDHDAQRLNGNVFLLAEFLQQKAPNYKTPKLRARAVLHKHCHHKSELKHLSKAEDDLLREMGVDFEEPELSCCGMAGAFGYEPRDHYDVSIACGERALLPQVRQVDDQTLVIADGFSCREQIAQTTDRHALHFAHVVQLAMRRGASAVSANQRPEAGIVAQRRQARSQAARRGIAVLTGGIALGAAIYLAFRARKASPSLLRRKS